MGTPGPSAWCTLASVTFLSCPRCVQDAIYRVCTVAVRGVRVLVLHHKASGRFHVELCALVLMWFCMDASCFPWQPVSHTPGRSVCMWTPPAFSKAANGLYSIFV